MGARSRRWSTFLSKPAYEQVNSLRLRYWSLKTRIFYARVFGNIGRGCRIRRPMMISNPQFIYLGEHVLINPGARLEALVLNPLRTPRLSIGDNVNIEQNAHIICHSRVDIGRNVTITGNCAIVDVTHPYRDPFNSIKIGSRFLDEDSFVEIGEGSFIGFASIILPNVRIGRFCVVGAHSLVSKDLPDYCVAAGNPAVVKHRYAPAHAS